MSETQALPAKATGYLALVRENGDFRSLWYGQIVSLLGDWFNLIASAALVANLTRSGLAVSGLFVVRMLAPFLVSPIAGVATDRYNRKHLLILTDLLRGVIVLGFLVVRRPEQVWLLYSLTALQLAISGFFFPARNAILPDVVDRNELGAANALSASTWSVMLALGAALGGIAAGEWGLQPAFVVDSLSFFLSAFFISRVHYHHQPPLHSEDKSLRALFIAPYVEGLRYLFQHPDIFHIALQKGAVSLTFGGIFQVVQVALAERVFIIGEGGGTSLGLMYAVGGIGTGLGPILARRFTGDRDRAIRIALGLSYAICFLGLVITAPLTSFFLVQVGTFVRAFGGGMNWVFSTQLLLQWVPDRVRGRVFSSEFAMFTLANAVGAAAGGWALDSSGLSLSTMIWWTAAFTLIPGLIWTWSLVRRLAKETRSEPQSPAV